MGLFLPARASSARLFTTPPTTRRASQRFGTGDGATTSFALQRVLGGFSEPVVAPVTTATTLLFPGGAFRRRLRRPSHPGGGLDADDARSPSSFAPRRPRRDGSARPFGYRFICRFDGDDLDFEQFMANLWTADSVKFRSVRTS